MTPNVVGMLGTAPKGLKKFWEELEIRGIPYNIQKICLNTKKKPGELRRLAVTQTPVKTTL